MLPLTMEVTGGTQMAGHGSFPALSLSYCHFVMSFQLTRFGNQALIQPVGCLFWFNEPCFLLIHGAGLIRLLSDGRGKGGHLFAALLSLSL